MGHPHPVTNRLDAHNCWLVGWPSWLSGLTCANIAKADVQKEYITWIMNKGYAVIDVNIPKHVSKEPVSVADV